MVWGIIVLLAALSGFFYRCGGAAKTGGKWDWIRNTKTRDVGCSLLATVAINLTGSYSWWQSLIHFGALWGLLTTYWDFLNHDKEVWWTWLITGLFYGLCAAPFLLGSLSLLSFTLRCTVLAGFSAAFRGGRLFSAVVEEIATGVVLVLSILLFI